MAGGGEKEGFSLAPIFFSQFDVGSEFAWLVPVLIETQTKNTLPEKPSWQAITYSNLQFLCRPYPLLSASKIKGSTLDGTEY